MKKILLFLSLFIPVYGESVMNSIRDGVCVPPYADVVAAAPSFNGYSTLDANGEKGGAIFQFPKTGNITGACIKLGSITTGASPSVSFQTLISTVPSGVPICTAAVSTISFSGTGDNLTYCSGSFPGCAVVRGSTAAFVVTNATGNFALSGIQDYGMDFPFTISSTGAAGFAAALTNAPVLSVVYDDGTKISVGPTPSVETITAVTVSTSSTPNVVGNKFTFPIDVEVYGVWYWGDNDSLLGDIVIYNTDYSTILATATIRGNLRGSAGAALKFMYFTSTVTLNANTGYRVGLRSHTTTTNGIYRYDFDTQAEKEGSNFGLYMTYTTARNPTGSGSWTDTSTSFATLGLMISGFGSTAAGGGTSAVPFIQ